MTSKIAQKETRRNRTRESGFTFIELLIVILIMSLLFGLGYANYKNFARRKATEGIVRKIVGELRYTQQIANSVKKPAVGDCASSAMERFEFRIGTHFEYEVVGICEAGSFEDKSGSFTNNSNITLIKSHSNAIEFKILGKGSNYPDGTTLEIADIDGNAYKIDISATGVIKSSL